MEVCQLFTEVYYEAIFKSTRSHSLCGVGYTCTSRYKTDRASTLLCFHQVSLDKDRRVIRPSEEHAPGVRDEKNYEKETREEFHKRPNA